MQKLKAVWAIAMMAALAVPSAVLAHHINPRHSATVVVLPSDTGVEVRAALILELPPNARSRRIIAQHDLNRSGAIEPAEGRILAETLGPEAVGGFVLMADGSAPVPDSIDGTATSDGEGRIRVAILLTYHLPRETSRVGVKVLERAGGDRVEARPVHLTMELREGDEIKQSLPMTIKRPGEDATEIVIEREAAEPEGGEEEAGAASPKVSGERRGGKQDRAAE